MFLIRAAFWLFIILMLLPTDSKQQIEVYGTAQAAVKDVSGFCERNPDACVKGMNIINMLVQKAEFGAQMLVGFVQEQSAGNPEATEAVAPEPTEPPSPAEPSAAPISFEPGADVGSQNTLDATDLEAQWGGPGVAGA